MLLALNAIRPDKNNNPPKAATIQNNIISKITPTAFDPLVVRFESLSLSTEEEISGATAAKPPPTSSEIRPQNIKQRLLIVVLYLPHLISARHPARG